MVVGSEHYYNFHAFLKMTLTVRCLSGVSKSLFGFIFGLGLAFIEYAIFFLLKERAVSFPEGLISKHDKVVVHFDGR